MSEEGVGNSNLGPQSSNDDVVMKYKRLLSMARSSLEANQQTLAAKDLQINQLLALIEEERAKRQQSKQKEDETLNFPNRAVSRVDVGGVVWVLLDYDGQAEWKSFPDEFSLEDYIKRIPGIPLQFPHKCLSIEESSRLIEECKRKIEKIVEEFRRYKVRTELTMKQKDAEIKSNHFQINENISIHKTSNSNNNNANTEKMNTQISTDSSDGDEISRLKIIIQEQDLKWRSSYEKIAKENELLKAKGAESVVATQWRARYEHCLRDRDELSQKLSILTHLSEEVTSTQKNAEELYLDLHEEYKGLRKRLLEQVYHMKNRDFQQLNASDWEQVVLRFESVLELYHIDAADLDPQKILTVKAKLNGIHNRVSSDYEETPSPRGNNETKGKLNQGLAESKVQYVRQMIFKYFMCKDPEVKAHIEAAIMTLFRFSNEERDIIERVRKEDQVDTLSSITSFLGSFTT